ncbi:MFS general substrate transporter [Mycena chlorophos]|uniref:MFS general substrate transporter n=1 Tax=Mycena chlorophos TaxID=658473 RepID=A0A8H6WIS2_MYCCL|nr:MFS general substrate transporter [Mycena chlorophos]
MAVYSSLSVTATAAKKLRVYSGEPTPLGPWAEWLLIIDAIVTLPIAALGFAFLPNHPWSKRPSFWLNAEEVALARARMQAIGRKGREPWTRAKYNAGVQSPMQYWMKSFNATPPPVPGVSWTVAQIQLYPLPTTAIFAVAAIIAAWLSDGPAKGRRWPFLLFGGVFGLIMDIVWLKMPLYTNIGGHLAYFWLIMLGAASGALSLNWVSEICSDDNELRAITVALSNDLAYVVTAVAPNFVWKTTSFPRALEGYHWSIGMQILSCALLWTFLILRLLWRDRQKLRAMQGLRASE